LGEGKIQNGIRAEFLKAILRKVSRPVLLLLLTAAVAAPQEPAKDASSIKNFLRVNEQICTGGQPTMAELEKLKQEGVRAVINLRRPNEYNAEEEAAKVRELGLRYVNIPVDHSDPQDAQVEDFLKATDDPANRPAFIHCAAANRGHVLDDPARAARPLVAGKGRGRGEENRHAQPQPARVRP